MALNINEGRFTGRLGKKPEIREVGDTVLCYISLAQNTRNDETVWVPFTVFGQSAKFLADYADKGDLVYAEYTVAMFKGKEDEFATPRLNSNRVQILPKQRDDTPCALCMNDKKLF